MERMGLIIDGREVAGTLDLDVINPATEAVCSICARATPQELDAAVAAATTAFPGWAATSQAERRARLGAIATALEQRSDAFAQRLTTEQGKTLEEARQELAGAVGLLRAFAAMDLTPRLIEDGPDQRVTEHRTPLGVVAAITPWNFPLFILMTKLAPALLTGNTMVVKPAPTTPLTTLMFGALCLEHLPPGVLNVIVDDNNLGSRLSGHPGVAKVAFTGSTATGRKVMASAAPGLKRLTLELGGNDPAIVLADVDPRAAAAAIYQAAFANAGQVCVAIKRVYVHARILETFCAALAELADATIVGDGAAPETHMGPLNNKAQYDKVAALIRGAMIDGTLIAGGPPTEKPGYFVRPTVVRDIADDAPLVREEQFGPLLPILSFTDIDDVVDRANAGEYGLGASVWSADLETASAIAHRLVAGTVWINKHQDLQAALPFRGARQSGIGVELGLEGLEEYTQPHIVNVAKAPLRARPDVGGGVTPSRAREQS